MSKFTIDRRVADTGANIERRGSISKRMNYAQNRVDKAIDDLCQTVSMTRSELFAEARREVANDTPHTVIFSTFAEICKYRTKQGAYYFCLNGAHDASGTGKPRCSEDMCPLLRKRAVTK